MKIKGCGIAILILLILAIVGFGVYVYLHNQKKDTDKDLEKVAWLEIKKWEGEMQLDSLDKAISMYQWNFPHGVHSEMVRAIKDKLEIEKKDWINAKYTDKVEVMEDFIRQHSDSYYRVDANRKLDSLTYIEAEEAETYEALQAYLESYPDGLYAKQAEKKMEDIDKGVMSDNEGGEVESVIHRHFAALADNNKSALAPTIADNLTTYIGKSHITRTDVENYMANIHAITGRTVTFDIKNIIKNKEMKDHI